jgi:hypothetical protein
MAAPMRRKQRGFGDEKTQILEITEVIAIRHFGEPFGIIIRQLGICIVMGERRAYSANPGTMTMTTMTTVMIMTISMLVMSMMMMMMTTTVTTAAADDHDFEYDNHDNDKKK